MNDGAGLWQERPRRDGGRWGRWSVVLAAGGLAALFTVTLAGRWVAAPPAPLALAVILLPYLYAAVAVMLFLAWTALPDRRGLPVALGALAVAAMASWSPGPSRWAPRPQGLPLRLATWNLQRLWGHEGAERCVVDRVRAEAPDVLTLLEVSAEDVAHLSAELGLTCVHHPYTSRGGGKAGGLASCVRGDRWTLGSGEGQRFVDDEDWYYVFSEVRSAGRIVNVLGVHLYPYRVATAGRKLVGPVGEHGLPDGVATAEEVLELGRRTERVFSGQSDQAAALLERVARFSDPTVVAGDFNSTRDTALHHELRRRLTDAWAAGGLGFGATVRLLGLPLRVDHVYTSPELGVVETRVPEAHCSDHRPVIADLVLRTE